MNQKAIHIPGLGKRVYFKARLRTLFAAIASLSGTAFVWRLLVARHGVRILAYHGVEPTPSSPFSVSVESFKMQVAHLAAHYDVLDLPTLLRWQRGEYASDKPKIVLTFDDGFRNNLEFASPILKQYKLPATFFVIAGKLDQNDSRFMTAAEIHHLLNDKRFRIGSHTLNHRSVAQIDDAGRQEEIGTSKARLEKELSQPIDHFCYPYGTFNDFDHRSVAVLKQYRYALACTSINGINLRGADPFRLRRTKVEWSDNMTTFRRLLDGAMDGWFFIDYFLRFLQRPRAVRFDQKTILNAKKD